MSDTERQLELAEKALLEDNLDLCYEMLSNIAQSSLSITNYIKRAEIHLRLKSYINAEDDLTSALGLSSKDLQNKKYIVQILVSRISVRESLEKYGDALSDNNFLYEYTKDPIYIDHSKRLLKLEKENKLKLEAGTFLLIFKCNLETKPGSEWHVISTSWFEKWQKFVNISAYYMQEEIPFKVYSKHAGFNEYPGAIDNSDIIDEEQSSIILKNPSAPHTKICLQRGIIENINFQLIPAPAFEFLSDIYGVNVDIKRYAIEVNDTMYQVEVFLKIISISAAKNGVLETDLIQITRKATIETLKKFYMQSKSLSGLVKVWKINLGTISMEKIQAYINVTDPVYLEGGKVLVESLLIDDAEIGDQDMLLIETAKNNKFFFTDVNKKTSKCGFCQSTAKLSVICSTCKLKKYCSTTCQNKDLNEHKEKCRPIKRSLLKCLCRASSGPNSDEEAIVVPMECSIKSKSGLVGLQNLGNTCFMNSAIQCLSHTTEITEIFLSGKYLEFLNKNNPLGTNGKLASAYAELLENLWKNSQNSYAPWKLKKIISAYAPQFSGYQQHDSQELLGFILDRIHEDLNLIKKKPYFEDIEIKEASDAEMSRESWQRHTLRNQSIVVDLMHGQYKSSLFCPSCQKYSYTFDPFNSITLPLPQGQEKIQNFYFIFYDSYKPPFSMAFEYFQGATFEMAYAEVSKLLEIPVQSFLFTLISSDTIKEVVQPKKLIEPTKNFTLFAYQFKEGANLEMVEVRMSIEKGKNKSSSYSRIVNIGQNSSFKDLHVEVFNKVKVFIPKYNSRQKVQETYEDLLQSPIYILYFVVLKDQTCRFCSEKTCKGCVVPYTSEKIKKFLAGTRLVLEVLWKSNYSSLGGNLSEVNRCTEHTSISEVAQKSRKNPVKLEDCFELFRVPEQLEKENAWYCPNCKAHVQATKKLEIYKVPPILIIHIKRFKITGHNKEKLYNPIIFPESGLDIKNWVIGEETPKLYDLYAVCNHFGNLSGGHYTATCFSQINKIWFEFDDSKVTISTENNSASAYVLFYRARQ